MHEAPIADRVLLFAAMLFSIFGAFVAIDLVNAAGALPCGSGGGPNCYPWGSEGPVAGKWSYESKFNYFVSGLPVATIPIPTAALLMWMCYREVDLSPRLRWLAAIGLVLSALPFLL